MGTIVNTSRTAGFLGGRHAGAFVDGAHVVRVEVRPGNLLVVLDEADRVRYTERALAQADAYSIQSIAAEVEAASGLLTLVLGGFPENSGDSLTLTVRTDYRPAIPLPPTAPALATFRDRLYLFAAGVDVANPARHPLYVRSRPAAGGAWGAWVDLGGDLHSSPAATATDDALVVAVVGHDAAHPAERPVYLLTTHDGATWGAWEWLGGNLA